MANPNHSDAWYTSASNFTHEFTPHLSIWVILCALVLILAMVLLGFVMKVDLVPKSKIKSGCYDKSSWEYVFEKKLNAYNRKNMKFVALETPSSIMSNIAVVIATVVLFVMFMKEHRVGFEQIYLNSLGSDSVSYFLVPYVVLSLGVIAVFGAMLLLARLLGKYIRLRIVTANLIKDKYCPRFVKNMTK